MTTLSASDKKHLRGVAQTLEPSVHVGTKGLTDSVFKEIETSLEKQELVKIRFQAQDKSTMSTICADIELKMNATLIGSIGKTACFYRASKKDA